MPETRTLRDRAENFLVHDEECGTFRDDGPGACDCIVAEIRTALDAPARIDAARAMLHKGRLFHALAVLDGGSIADAVASLAPSLPVGGDGRAEDEKGLILREAICDELAGWELYRDGEELTDAERERIACEIEDALPAGYLRDPASASSSAGDEAREELRRLAEAIRAHKDPEQAEAPLFDAIEEATGFAINAVLEFVKPEDLTAGIAVYVEQFAASLSSPLPGTGDGLTWEARGSRFEVECRECDDLDTYGNDDSYVELGREHVREAGHRVLVKATTFMDLAPLPGDGEEARA